MKKIVATFAKNTVFANVVLIMTIFLGFISVKNMVCETFPEFSLDVITVSIHYPGANPEEIEETISCKIENALEGIEGIEQHHTKSCESFCIATIEVARGYDINEVIYNVSSKINAISTLPTDAEKPIIKELILKDPVILLSLSGNVSEKSIKALSREIKDEIEQINEVSQIKKFGDRKYDICVEVSEKTLIKYGLSIKDITTSIKNNSLNLAAGKIKTSQEELRIRTMGKKSTKDEISSILILTTPTGASVPLSEIATIKDDFTKDIVEATVDNNVSILLLVYKTKKEDSLAISKSIKKYIIEKQSFLPETINLKILYDNTDMLKSRINLLLKNGLLGLTIVFFLLWILLDIRFSFWAVMGLLISFSGALTLLYLMEETINMVSLFSLIMVLGILVDDAIVVSESIYFNRKLGKSGLDAAVDGTLEVGIPVITAVTTSIIAFIPLFYVGGIMGKFISILPTIVIACLSVSLIESLFLLPAHLSHLSINNSKNEFFTYKNSKIKKIRKFINNKMNWLIYDLYKSFLRKILQWRYFYFSLTIALFLITIGFISGGILKFEVFPSIDGFIITSTAEFPTGTPISVTKKAIKKINNALISVGNETKTINGDPLIKSRLSLIGKTLEKNPSSGSNLGSVQAILLESEKRGIHSDNIMLLWKEKIGNIPGIKSLKFEGLSGGPPGAPIEIWIQGYNIDSMSKAAKELITQLKTFSGIYQVSSDLPYGENEIHVKLKPEGRHLNLNIKSLAQQINAAYYGYESFKIQVGKEDINVKVSYPLNERNNISNIENMYISTNEGKYVLLSSVANISFKRGYSSITRTNGLRRIVVSAKINTNKNNVNEIFLDLLNKDFPKLLEKYPNISISSQGEQKKMRESLNSLKIGFPIAIIGIFMVISTIFRSYLQPIVIMVTIPFGIIGAIWGHFVLGYNISIMSIFGMVALTGIVVNDSIVLIERINLNLASNMSFFEAIIEGSSRRFMAIFLTTISTTCGLAPIILETNLQAKVLIPMAISIAFGVAFASMLTLILIPSLLVILSDIRIGINKLKTGSWANRESLEPALHRYI